MDDRLTGTVKWFNDQKGYGFIARQGERDIFVHHTSIQMEGYRTLTEGQVVEFTLEQGPKGPAAAEVTKVSQPAVEEPLPM